MLRARTAQLGVAAAVLVAGCGGNGGTATTTTEHSASTAAAAAGAPAPSVLKSRVLASNELAGFKPVGVSAYTTADATTDEKAMLRRDGFRQGIHEDLMNGAGVDGASVVEQFRSPAAAQDALAFYVSEAKAPSGKSGGAYARLKASGIPGAVGFSRGGVNGGGLNVYFTDGPYYYFVGQEGGSAAAVARLNAAARHLYHRVHG